MGSKLRRIAEVLKDRRYLGFYLQRRFLNPTSRKVGSRVVAALRPKDAGIWRGESGYCDADVFDNYGLVKLPAVLSATQVDQIVNYFESLEASDPYRPELGVFLGGVRPGPSSHVAYHNTEDVLRAPHLLDFANDPRILKVVSEYFGCVPTISYMAAWWSFPTDKSAQQAELFHRDVDDFKFLKLFVYLTDVDESNGPHVYVANSAGSSKLRKIGRFSREDVLQQFSAEAELVLCGKRGDGFLENTQGIHRGLPVKSGRRLMFQAVYSLSILPYGPKRPVKDANCINRHHPWVNRVYVGS